MSNPLLYLIGGPIVVGMVCLPISEKLKIIAKILAFVTTFSSLVYSVFLFINRSAYRGGALSSVFNVDSLSCFIAMSISVFAFLITVYSFGFMKKHLSKYFAYVLMTLGSSLGVAFANDLILLLIFWGFLALTLYLLINIQGTNRANATAKKTMIIIGGTDAIMIFGIGLIWSMTGTFSMDKIHLPLSGAHALAAYISIAIAALAKAGAMPFHSWLPDVAEDSPTPVTAYLPASLDKLLGIYLLARASLSLFIMNKVSNTILMVVGSVTIVLAVVIALVQHDLKRLLGYHAVSQVGYMVLGIGTGNPIGIAGSLFHMINHAIYKSCLFLSGGDVEKNAGTTDLERLGGLAKYMPITFACFLTASLSISGIPPFNGFVSKWMIYQGIIESAGAGNRLWIVWLVSAMFGSALTLASFMKLLHTVFMGRPSKYSGNVKEVGFFMAFPILVLAGLCILFGVFAFPLPLSKFIVPSIGRSIHYLGIWNPTAATFLILVGIAAGLAVYYILKPGSFRSVGTFVGGEDPDEFERVSGADFYDTIKDLKGLSGLYKAEDKRSLDIYDQGKNAVSFFTKILQRLHNGVLPTYLVWCLLGTIAIFLIMFFR